MLTALAIINMTVASALITETADERAVQQEPTAVVSTVDTDKQSVEYISWSEE